MMFKFHVFLFLWNKLTESDWKWTCLSCEDMPVLWGHVCVLWGHVCPLPVRLRLMSILWGHVCLVRMCLCSVRTCLSFEDMSVSCVDMSVSCEDVSVSYEDMSVLWGRACVLWGHVYAGPWTGKYLKYQVLYNKNFDVFLFNFTFYFTSDKWNIIYSIKFGFYLKYLVINTLLVSHVLFSILFYNEFGRLIISSSYLKDLISFF